jgi:hypothetical protein
MDGLRTLLMSAQVEGCELHITDCELLRSCFSVSACFCLCISAKGRKKKKTHSDAGWAA